MRWLPGPGDLRDSRSRCRGGGCDHEHTSVAMCELCQVEFDSDGLSVCDSCEELLDSEPETLVRLLLETRAELARLRRAELRRSIDG